MMKVPRSERIRFGPFTVDLRTREIWKYDLKLKLSGQPLEILAILLERPGELVSREEIRSRLWVGDTFVDFNHGLNAAVNKLRDALNDSPEDPKYIETLPRRGYRFIGKLEEEEVQAPEVVPEVAAVENTPAPPVAVPVPQQPLKFSLAKSIQWPRSLKVGAIAIAILVACFVLLSFAWHLASSSESSVNADNLQSRHLRRLTNLTEPTSDPAFSPDGSRVAFSRAGNSPGIYVKQIDGEQLLQVTHDASDCCAVWSPDGQTIAFSRFTATGRAINTVPSQGGEVRQLVTTGLSFHHGELDWSPDGKFLAFSSETSKGSSSLFAYLFDQSDTRRWTGPGEQGRDWGPAFSPDGQHLAFVRNAGPGAPDQIMVATIDLRDSHQLTSVAMKILSPPAWDADGQSILFASDRSQDVGLWRVPIKGGDPFPVPEGGPTATRPAIARRGYHLAFQAVANEVAIWEMTLSSLEPHEEPLVTSGRGRNEGLQISPDGKKLAFMSDRSGSMEIWMSDRDGSNPIQLSAVGQAGTPRWSPDSKSIAFDSGWKEHGTVYVVRIDGGTPHLLVKDISNNVVPSWSRDGKWIYFASDRAGGWQIWKISPDGGSPQQMTTLGGFASMESFDGYLYYALNGAPNPEVRRMPIQGGPETPVSPLVQPSTWASWSLTDDGIYFVEQGANNIPILSFYDFRNRQTRRITALESFPFWLAASADGKFVAFEQEKVRSSYVMLRENFR
jgi:Tol biopolymer transport system component/DNA-binding winged helix-turn-helix (wHTH) protein